MSKTTPSYIQANGLRNIFTNTKKWTIDCGECDHCWTEKVPVREKCSAICPSCGAQNVWSITAFMKRYDEMIGK